MWIFLGLYIGNFSFSWGFAVWFVFLSNAFLRVTSWDGSSSFQENKLGLSGAIQAKRETSVSKVLLCGFWLANWQIKCHGTTDATLFLRSSSRKHSQSRGRRDAHRGTNFTKQLLRLISHGISTRVGFKNWQAGSQTQLQFSNNAM